MDNSKLKKDIISAFKPVIASWDEPDIYAISFYVENYCDNPCEPTVTLGYNTERRCAEKTKSAGSEEESRWNYAFWLQNEEASYGTDESKENVASWIKNNAMPYYPCVDYDFDIPDDVDDEQLDMITEEFVSALVDVVKELHRSGFIKEKFGKPIPVLIHELEYYDEIADRNIAANSKPVVKGFVSWIRDMYN
jgi:hypothetical protein